MSNVTKLYATADLKDGTEIYERVHLVDRLAYEVNARKLKWSAEDSPMQWAAFIAYSAGSRAGKLPPGMSWGEFQAAVIDAAVTNEPPAVDEAVDLAVTDTTVTFGDMAGFGDPTTPAASTRSLSA